MAIAGATFDALVMCLVVCVVYHGHAKPQSKKHNETAVLLPRHSFNAPLSFQDALGDWSVGGASVFERERLQLIPPVAERLGLLWSKSPLKTANFETIVHFRFAGDKAAFAPDQAMAVWFIEEDLHKAYSELALGDTVAESLKSAGLTFSGSKAKFKGFGVVLAIGDEKKNLKTTMSLVTNNNDKELVLGKDVVKTAPVDFRNTLNSAQLRVRIDPDYVDVQFKQSPSLSWQEIFKIENANQDTTIKFPDNAKGFIGVTAWSGAQSPTKRDAISITQVETYNYDDTSIGEDMKDVSAKIQEAYRDMLTDENRHFIDQKSQMEHLQRLTVMLADHVQEARPADLKIYEDLQALQARMSKMENECRTLSKEFEVLVNPAGGAGVGAVKDEIVGLRQLLIKDSHQHRQKLDEVSKNIKEVKEKKTQEENPKTLSTIASQSSSLETTVKARSTQMSWMLFVLIGCVLAIGFLMYNRMHYYEKKHFI